MAISRKDSLIDTMLKLTGFDEECVINVESQFTVLQKRYQLPDEKIKKIISKVGPGELRKRIVNLYSNHLTEEQLEEIIRFWTSPVGRHLMDKSFREKQKELGLMWGHELEQIFQKEYEKLNNK